MNKPNRGEKIIEWGQECGEVIRNTDIILADPGLFKGQIQVDGDLCNYLTFAAQVQLGKKTAREAYLADRTMGALGLKRVAESIRYEIGAPRLSSLEVQEELKRRVPLARQIDGLAFFAYPGESAGQAIVRMLEEDLLPSIALQSEDHAVLVIGHSEDEQELIVWDALEGEGDPKLRRIPTEREDLGFIAAVEIHPKFKKPRIEFG